MTTIIYNCRTTWRWYLAAVPKVLCFIIPCILSAATWQTCVLESESCPTPKHSSANSIRKRTPIFLTFHLKRRKKHFHTFSTFQLCFKLFGWNNFSPGWANLSREKRGDGWPRNAQIHSVLFLKQKFLDSQDGPKVSCLNWGKLLLHFSLETKNIPGRKEFNKGADP